MRAKVDGEVCDYVLCRKDGPYRDLRRPDFVEIGTLEDDLGRRDFTVNALAMTDDGFIIDLFDGLTHLKDRRLVTIRDPLTCFKEDPLRILRALRFSLTHDFTLDDKIQKVFREESALMGSLLTTLAVDR